MKLAPLAIKTQLIEAAGTATAQFHRLLQQLIASANAGERQKGQATDTPDPSGDIVITHSLQGAALEGSSASPLGGSAFLVQLVSIDDTSLTVRLFDTSGAALTSGSYTVAWSVGR